VAEHRFPGLGQANWAQIVHALLRAGYDSDLNIEGWHDPVYRDHGTTRRWMVKLAAGTGRPVKSWKMPACSSPSARWNSLFQKNYNILRMFNFALNPVASAARP